MRTTVDIDDTLMMEAMAATKARTKKEVIQISLENIVRRAKLQSLKNKLGKYDLDMTLEDLERMRRDD